MTDETTTTPEQDKVALVARHANDPAVTELLGAIFKGMRRDAEHTQSMMDRMWGSDRARTAQVMDGVTWALNASVWGGTTREYENTLDRVRRALYPDHKVREWYEKQVDEHDGHPGTLEFKVWPGYRSREVAA